MSVSAIHLPTGTVHLVALRLLRLRLRLHHRLLTEEAPAPTVLVVVPMLSPALLGNAAANMVGVEQRRTTVERAVSLPSELALAREEVLEGEVLEEEVVLEEVVLAPTVLALVPRLSLVLLGNAAASMGGAEQHLPTVELAVRLVLAHAPRLLNFVEIGRGLIISYETRCYFTPNCNAGRRLLPSLDNTF